MEYRKPRNHPGSRENEHRKRDPDKSKRTVDNHLQLALLPDHEGLDDKEQQEAEQPEHERGRAETPEAGGEDTPDLLTLDDQVLREVEVVEADARKKRNSDNGSRDDDGAEADFGVEYVNYLRALRKIDRRNAMNHKITWFTL